MTRQYPLAGPNKPQLDAITTTNHTQRSLGFVYDD
jgi:hypothetical protein